MKIYVGNLSPEVTEEELRQEFAAFGTVTSVAIPLDRVSGRSRGFAFVEMSSISEGQAAIAGLNGKNIKDRTLAVDAARPPQENKGGGFRKGSGGYGGRGGGFDKGRPRRY